MAREVWVHMDVGGEPVPVGRLWMRARGRRESASFEYASEWLEHPLRFALEPALPLGPGAFHSRGGLFGSIGDSAPDRWGRVLLRRGEVRLARREGRTPRTLFDSDFLLRVDDEVRIGAVRFSAALGGPFLAEPPSEGAWAQRVPPLLELSRLLGAADRVGCSEEGDEDLRLLIGPGSSLGGARPKAAVRDRDGALAIAKFPHREDDRDIVLWEGVALALAARAGIRVPDWRIEGVAGRRVLLVRRFDRIGRARVPFLSAMTMLGARDNEPRSYLEIADAIRQHGAEPRGELAELWRRVVFNVLVANTDDHLRNHGFVRRGGGGGRVGGAGGQRGSDGAEGWRLSPAYDLNPVPSDVGPRVLSTMIDEHDGPATPDRVMATAEYYGLSPAHARGIAGEVADAVARWRDEAVRLGASGRKCDGMESAFGGGGG